MLWKGAAGAPAGPAGDPGTVLAAEDAPAPSAARGPGPGAAAGPGVAQAPAAVPTPADAGAGAAAGRSAWTQHAAFQVDEPALLDHPGLALVVAEGADGRLALARWTRTGPQDGRVEAGAATDVGFALRAPNLEVVGWSARAAERGELGSVPLSAWVELVAFEVVDANGAAVTDVTWTRAHAAARVGEAALPLPTDARGRLLLPRHARLELRADAAGGTARVSLPSAQRKLVIGARE